jgi:hypothetical protein
MDLLFNYHQDKKHKDTKTRSYCNLKLYKFNNLIHYLAEFSFTYHRYDKEKTMSINHGLTIDLKNGDITSLYQIINKTPSSVGTFGLSKNTRIKNKFDKIMEMTDNGFYHGEKRKNFWGVKHDKSLNKIFDIILKNISPEIKSEFLKGKDYTNKPVINPLFDLLVDFHLDKKKIKSHDSVYFSIQHEYPKIKWLKLNEYNFLPSVLDSYGIKTKYLIGEINKHETNDINIRSVNYLCKLFGENYIDYLKQINWIAHCCIPPLNRKHHELKNESEKRFMVKLINNWEKDNIQNNHLIEMVNELLSIREFLETKNINLKFNAKNDAEFELIYKQWENMKSHFKKGYRIRYLMSSDFVSEIEKDIMVGENIFKPTILKTEEDYTLEGFIMKNCMGKQFINGLVHIYITLSHKKKRINLQYRKGVLLQKYGKANTPVEIIFNEPIQVLNKRMLGYSDTQWVREKYDFIR